METKECLSCGKTIKGRSDKKFCDDYCRNNYNNSLKSDHNNTIRNINNALRKNRRILEAMITNKETMTKTTRDKLLEQGFSFKYFTHQYTNQKGNIYHFCYEYGYLALENNWFLVVKRDAG
jgi:transcriptional accessory protein Tex/SPT6